MSLKKEPDIVKTLLDEVAHKLSVVDSSSDTYSHITKEERSTVRNSCKETEKWLKDLLDKQAKLEPFDDPCVKVIDIKQKIADMNTICDPIIKKKKPQPPKSAEKENEETNANSESNPQNNSNENVDASAEEPCCENNEMDTS